MRHKYSAVMRVTGLTNGQYYALGGGEGVACVLAHFIKRCYSKARLRSMSEIYLTPHEKNSYSFKITFSVPRRSTVWELNDYANKSLEGIKRYFKEVNEDADVELFVF